MRALSCVYIVCFFSQLSFGQVGISPTGNIPDPSSMLDIYSPGKGLLIPRMTLAERNSIMLPANALLIYQTDGTAGFYYNEGTPLAPVWIYMLGDPGDGHLEDRIPIDSLPYTISMTGSYYVTANLTGPVGITITTSHVTLDLNGYTLKGSPGNTSEGVEVTATATNIVIRNGGITGWGREGIKAILATNSSFTALEILNNALDGIYAGNNNLGSFLVAGNNGFDGIDFGLNAVIYHSTAANNSYDGIEVDAGSSVVQCTASDNTQHGIRTTGSTTLSLNTCAQNDGSGLSCGAGSTVTQNTASNNQQSGIYLSNSCLASDNVSRNNGNHGFEWLNDCVLQNNSATLNDNSGFRTTSNGGKVDNNFSSTNAQHGFDIQNGGGCLITRNTASGNGVNAFNVLAGNSFATVVTSATINTNTNPFANFQL